MAQEWAISFYRSTKWQRCREAYIQGRILKDGGLCEKCQENPGYIVHHKRTLTPESIKDPDISLNKDELMYVCKDCHDLFEGHGVNKRLKPLCRFGADGQPVSLREIDREEAEY